MTNPEELWAGILSRRAVHILAAWHTLDAEERTAVYAHLVRMATEEGWTEPQRVSAQAALDVLPAPDDKPGSEPE